MESRILAKVNGIAITLEDVDNFLNRLDPQIASQYRNQEGSKQIVNELINQKLFLYDAIDNKLDETEAYKSELQKAREFILTQLNINRTMHTDIPTDKEVEEFFEDNQGKFDKPESADTSHILVDSLELCQKLREKITANEISFENAAKRYSSCPSKDNGGNLGNYARGQMVLEYDNAAFQLEIDEISQPVKTQFGFHLIKLNSKSDSLKASYKEVEQDVKKELQNLKQREQYIAQINRLRRKYPVELLQ